MDKGPGDPIAPKGPGAVRAILTVAHLTFQEARRRRVLAASLGLGAAFVAIFATGLYFIVQDMRARMPSVQQGLMISFVVTAALYAANFLIVVTSVLVAVDTVAGEIASGVIETLYTKPVARAAIMLGKWLGCWLLLVAYLGLTGGGVLAVAPALAGYTPPHAALGVSLMLLEGTPLLTLAVAGGAPLATLANGVTVLGLYRLAFLRGWVEQLGTLLGNPTARYLGIAPRLLVPREPLWQPAPHPTPPAPAPRPNP